MTRTGMSPRLGQHLPEPFVEIHPDDAARTGVTDAGYARVTTDYGQCVLRVVVSDRQQRGIGHDDRQHRRHVGGDHGRPFGDATDPASR